MAEVITPVLGLSGGTDPAIEPLQTCCHGPGFASGLTLYLQPSPEFFMKRLLAAGSGSIYQIAQVFRDGESGKRHNPEFTLLEWYRPGFDHHQLIAETAELAQHLLETPLPVQKLSYCELFQQQFSWHPLSVSDAELERTARDHGVAVTVKMERDQWLDLLMSLVIEKQLGRDRLTFVYDYPASQASLARLNPHDPQLASRFELYYQGVELANGFHELLDAEEQLQRFEADNRQRRAAGQNALPIDHQLIEAMRNGMPDCAGVAVGLDRLWMLKLNAASLDEVLNFSFPQL